MKSVFISMLALATTVGSYANQPNQVCCPVDCPNQKVVVLAVSSPVFSASSTAFVSVASESFATKMAIIEDAHENKQGYLNFQQTMSAALNQVETERLLSAAENLKSLSSFSRTMTNAFRQIEDYKHAEASENALASEQYNNLMEKALQISSGIF
jgi:hypothetical protein